LHDQTKHIKKPKLNLLDFRLRDSKSYSPNADIGSFIKNADKNDDFMPVINNKAQKSSKKGFKNAELDEIHQ
jgi:hypothetical protein